MEWSVEKCMVCNGSGLKQVFCPDANTWVRINNKCDQCYGHGERRFRIVETLGPVKQRVYMTGGV